jgi:broad specificity phosphatase PhoE
VTRRVVLLRHGRTTWNAEHRFQGQADPPLDDVGRAQAWEVAGIIAAMRPDLLVSSTAARAMQTAVIVAEATGLPVRREPRLVERGLGHWEGLTMDEVAARYPDEYAEWAAGQDVTRRGGETREAVAARACAAFAELSPAELAVIVSHGATTMALTNALLGLEQRTHVLGPLANCHWTELYAETRRSGTDDRAADGAVHRAPRWRLRGHNLGAPGTIVPVPAVDLTAAGAEASDADA